MPEKEIMPKTPESRTHVMDALLGARSYLVGSLLLVGLGGSLVLLLSGGRCVSDGGFRGWVMSMGD